MVAGAARSGALFVVDGDGRRIDQTSRSDYEDDVWGERMLEGTVEVVLDSTREDEGDAVTEVRLEPVGGVSSVDDAVDKRSCPVASWGRLRIGMASGFRTEIVLVCAAASMAVVLGACDSFPEKLTCERDEQCRRGDRVGRCVGGRCALPDEACSTGYRWDRTARMGAGDCVQSLTDADTPDGSADGGDSSTVNECGGTMPLAGQPGEPCGRCGLGEWACDGLDDVVCEGEPRRRARVTYLGEVEASSEYGEGFEAERAVDDDEGSSWFTAGVEVDAAEYHWRLRKAECIAQIKLVGNANHRDPDLREGYGFDEVTVQVLGPEGAETHSHGEALPGTPDPTVVVEPDVLGREVVLYLGGHEDPERGGFSELVVETWRDGSECIPTTCTAADATCGSISDGCGGAATVPCGSCYDSQVCSMNRCQTCSCGGPTGCAEGFTCTEVEPGCSSCVPS